MTRSVTSIACFSSILNHLYITVFVLVNFADTQSTDNKPDDKPYLRGFFTTSLVSGSEKLGHPTQKSLKLMEDIISIHTNPGELILDPFMGSGSTGEAALKQGRCFLGIEYDQTYFNIAKKRLELMKDK